METRIIAQQLPDLMAKSINGYVIELDDGKFYRKALYLMVKTMVSCKISLKPMMFAGSPLTGWRCTGATSADTVNALRRTGRKDCFFMIFRCGFAT